MYAYVTVVRVVLLQARAIWRHGRQIKYREISWMSQMLYDVRSHKTWPHREMFKKVPEMKYVFKYSTVANPLGRSTRFTLHPLQTSTFRHQLHFSGKSSATQERYNIHSHLRRRLQPDTHFSHLSIENSQAPKQRQRGFEPGISLLTNRRGGVVVSRPAWHATDLGSIPGPGMLEFRCKTVTISNVESLFFY